MPEHRRITRRLSTPAEIKKHGCKWTDEWNKDSPEITPIESPDQVCLFWGTREGSKQHISFTPVVVNGKWHKQEVLLS